MNVLRKTLNWTTFFVVLTSIYLIFVWVPNERVMGPVQKIFYYHVSAAWISFMAFFVVFISGVLYLVTRNKKWDLIGASSAEIGVLFTTIVLITGPIWARPVWNTWWTWDARLTTTLILWFIYLAYLMIRAAINEEEKKERIAAVFGIIGFIDVPIVWFSIRWWRTIHPVVLNSTGFALSPKMTLTLLISVISFTLIYIILLENLFFLKKSRGELEELKETLRSRN
ncbi:MAG: cytochrome c biogenesis protein [Bacillota bacterium]